VHNLSASADDVVCIMTPENFGGVGAWYDDFSQTSDEEVHRLLEAADHLFPSTHVQER
jgi:putative phosphoribosyl transferase